MIRIHGDLKRLDHPAMTKEEVHALIYDIMSDSQRKTFEESHECDFSFELSSLARFRVNVFMQRKGEGAVFRTIPTKILTLEELGMPPILKQLCEKEKGLILVTGPTGSGKSTTLAAMVDYLNSTFEGHILTVEDPIEFVHQSKKCLVNQRELGPHTESFSNALRSALREDPDIILVGEMRDLETIQLALTAAETGHIVFGTLHTSSAPKTVDRIIDVFPPAQQAQIRSQFAESVEAVITQTLLKKKSGGRAAALEIMTGTTAVRNLIREGKIHQIPGTMQVSQKDGMQTMDMALTNLVNRGIVTKEEAQSKSMNPNLFGAAQPAAAVGGRA
jgi:twitching motility protein PilT